MAEQVRGPVQNPFANEPIMPLAWRADTAVRFAELVYREWMTGHQAGRHGPPTVADVAGEAVALTNALLSALRRQSPTPGADRGGE